MDFLGNCFCLETYKAIKPNTNAAMDGIKAILNKGVTANITESMDAIKPSTTNSVLIIFNVLIQLPI
jgi:hypothetical protein